MSSRHLPWQPRFDRFRSYHAPLVQNSYLGDAGRKAGCGKLRPDDAPLGERSDLGVTGPICARALKLPILGKRHIGAGRSFMARRGVDGLGADGNKEGVKRKQPGHRHSVRSGRHASPALRTRCGNYLFGVRFRSVRPLLDLVP
jgi:hypothetical protein